MSFSDMASRIGAIQGTLARVGGAAETVVRGPLPASSAAGTEVSPLPGSAQSAGAIQLQGSATPAAFTQALQEALAPISGPASNAEPQATVRAPSPGSAAPLEKAKAAHNEPPATSNGVDGSDVVQAAQKYLGVPYVWGGNNPKIGLDCSSFVQHTFKDLGVDLPRVARQQATEGTEVPSLAQARPGDLIVTRGGGHIGIYLGDNKMIHAPRPGEHVSIRKLFETDAEIMTIRRIVPSESAGTPESKPVAGQARDAASHQAELSAAVQRALFSTAVNAA